MLEQKKKQKDSGDDKSVKDIKCFEDTENPIIWTCDQETGMKLRQQFNGDQLRRNLEDVKRNTIDESMRCNKTRTNYV